MSDRRDFSVDPSELSSLDLCDNLVVNNTRITLYKEGSNEATLTFKLKEVGEWKENENLGQGVVTRRIITDNRREFLIVKDALNNELYIANRDGEPIFGSKKMNLDVDTYEQSKFEAIAVKKPRPVSEMKELVEAMESRKLHSLITDENGHQVCQIAYDPDTRYIVEVRTVPFVNIEEEAEHNDEHIYATHDDGTVDLDKQLTRREARENKERYLVVSCLIFHGRDTLVQKRSNAKKIDPGLISTGAHGVAKEIKFSNGGQRAVNTEYIADINMALEINEELRYGPNERQFLIKFWPGTAEELWQYAEQENIDDADTVYVVRNVIYADAGYDLNDMKNKRTRATYAGYIFSKERPRITFDPAESSAIDWINPNDVYDRNDVAEDLRSLTDDQFQIRFNSKHVTRASP